MRSLVKTLTGTEIKVFIAICLNSENGKYKNLEFLLGYDLTYPTILSAVDVLEKKNFIKKELVGREIEITFLDPYNEMAEHVKAFRPQLKFKLEAEPAPDPKKKTDQKEILNIMYYYGRAKGVTDDRIKLWINQNFVRLVRSVKRLLEFTGDVEIAKAVIENAREHYDKEGLDWSLQGAVLNNINKFMAIKPKGEKKVWNW